MGIETDLLHALNNSFAIKEQQALRVISDSAAIVAYGSSAMLLLIGFWKKRPRLRRMAIVVLAATLGTALIVNVLKHTIDRERPFETLDAVTKLDVGGGGSFPSGHTGDAFAAAMIFSLLVRRWWVATPLFIWACAVGWTRMALGVHYPSDVLAGAFIGVSFALLTHWLSWVRRRNIQITDITS
ncbi:MAG: phosphatase PAP2 family protein [Flavobacteriales bacterium]|nr:phosphatase PAP2 family protein [Flavobacteriales bacterium]